MGVTKIHLHPITSSSRGKPIPDEKDQGEIVIPTCIDVQIKIKNIFYVYNHHHN
jgi:hypothetical protein